jgi:hypothetical protein
VGTSDLERFSGGSQDKGINTFEPDIAPTITWDEDTHDVSGGVRRGVAPRYGMAPLPGHSDTETLSGNNTNGLRKSEGSAGIGAGLTSRELIYGIVPIVMAPYDGDYPKANRQYYLYLVGLDDGSNVTLDACFGATLVSGVNKQEANIQAGLAQSSYREESPLVRRHKTELLNLPQTTTPTAANMQEILRSVGSRYWVPYAHISIPGKRIPYQWMLGYVTTDPTATTTPAINVWTVNGFSPTAVINAGAPSEIITREFVTNSTRTIYVESMDFDGTPRDLQYTALITPSDTTPVSAYGTGAMYAAVTGSKTGAYTAYSNVEIALINDPGSYTNSRHDAVLIAGETPFAIVYQDWLKAVKGMMPRWVDLTNPTCIPRLLGINPNVGNVQLASSMPNAVPSVNSPNTGVLRAGRTYEFGFSMYNKQLDYETNVSYGVTFEVPVVATDDFYSIDFDQLSSTDNVYRNYVGSSPNYFSGFPWDFTNSTIVPSNIPYYPRGLSLNDYEYRLYFREYGTNEWLPGGSYDCAQYWFSRRWTGTPANPQFCTGPVAGLPGGQPNGFIDYSPLPKQRYISAVSFQNRAFWFAEKSMHFSLANNIYAYPTRNITTLPAGAWLGGMVHTRTGEVDQQSRLIMFATNATYIGRFTGEKFVQSVRISSDTVGQFEVDGSDFAVDVLTDGAAFSARAACVAEGMAYWWGSQGVYRYDGVTMPQNLSQVLEPDIQTFLDMGDTMAVHCIYNKNTDEVIWFYPPKVDDADYPTYGLIYNVNNGNFYYTKFPCYVDASQNLKLENDATPDDVDGERCILHCRETSSSLVSRSYFFDERCKSGDMVPGTEMVVEAVSTPGAANVRRLTLATGGLNPSVISVGDYVAIQNVAGYAPSITTATDMIAKVTAVDSVSRYIEIELPTGGVLPNATLTQPNFFPVYHGGRLTDANPGVHGIKFQLSTNYWLPSGVADSWLWQFFYLLYKFTSWPSPIGAKMKLAYRTLRCGGFAEDELTLTDNSDGHCQIHHPLRPVQGSAQGQAIKYKISGVHIGQEWTLEYLEAHCLKERGFTLKAFEG